MTGYYVYYGKVRNCENTAHYVTEVLAGDLDFLWSVFIWEDTPQGHDHWSSIVFDRTELTAADRMYLGKLRAFARRHYGHEGQ